MKNLVKKYPGTSFTIAVIVVVSVLVLITPA